MIQLSYNCFDYNIMWLYYIYSHALYIPAWGTNNSLKVLAEVCHANQSCLIISEASLLQRCLELFIKRKCFRRIVRRLWTEGTCWQHVTFIHTFNCCNSIPPLCRLSSINYIVKSFNVYDIDWITSQSSIFTIYPSSANAALHCKSKKIRSNYKLTQWDIKFLPLPSE